MFASVWQMDSLLLSYFILFLFFKSASRSASCKRRGESISRENLFHQLGHQVTSKNHASSAIPKHHTVKYFLQVPMQVSKMAQWVKATAATQ